MIANIAYSYVRFLLTVELLLLSSSMLLHLSVLMGWGKPYAETGLILFRAAVVAMISAAPFMRDSLAWVHQIKTCPKWMWKGALGLGVYGLLTIGVGAILRPDAAPPQNPVAISGFPLGFDAINLCILYSVLRSGYLDPPNVVRRALQSVITIAASVAIFAAYHTGYLPRTLAVH